MTSSGRWARHGSTIVLDIDGVGDASSVPRTLETEESPTALEPTSLLGSLADRFRQLVQAGQEVWAITEAASRGQTDVNQLTNLVFFARHPELQGRQIRPEQRQLAQEWLTIRDTVVRPVLAPLSGTHPARPSGAMPTTAPPSAPVIFGVDTASVDGNKNPNWAQAKAAVPLEFAIIRSNWGVSPDGVFHRDWPQINAAGMVRGAYLFLRFPHSKWPNAPHPVAQAEALIRTVGDLDQSDLPPTLDVEFPGSRAETKMTAQQILEGVRDAWNVLKDHYGVAPIIYTSARVWREDLDNLPAPDLVESPLWLARYPFPKGPVRYDVAAFAGGRLDPPVPPPWGDATNWWIHQYQGDAVHLPGFPTGTVDMNRFNTMIKGTIGDRVKWVQRRLGILSNGIFDATTEAALRAFREERGLGDGAVVDPRTFAYLCWSKP